MKLPLSTLRKPAPLLILLAACAAIGACTETRFAAPPGDQWQSCDPQWKGLWVPRSESNSDSAFFVDDACHFVLIEVPKNGAPAKRTSIALKYVHADGKNYLVVPDDALKNLVDIKPVYGIEPVPKRAYYLARYVATSNRIDVYSVDAERVATRIIEHKLDGTVSKIANELHVFVTGDSAHTLEILRGDSIFADKPGIELERSKLSADEFEQQARQSAHGKK
ncbi:MAG TPA: hypothetical protein VFN13_07900 [Rudaea sp.]|nr:hypothetical protein [Rudaea sp.]